MPIHDDGSGWMGLLVRLLLGGAVVVLSGCLGRLFARPALAGLSRLAWDTASGLPVFIGVLLIVGQFPIVANLAEHYRRSRRGGRLGGRGR